MGRDLPDTFEGDMILSKEQALAAKFGMDVDEPIGRGGAMETNIGREVFLFILLTKLLVSTTCI